MVETVKDSQAEREEKEEKKERLGVLAGLRKYAADHVLLSGKPGSGKSTALVRLLLEEANKSQKSKVKSQKEFLEPIPVLVELRYYQTSILDLIQKFLQRHAPNLILDEATLITVLKQGQFFLLIDGVNELPSDAARRDLFQFRQDYQKTTPMIFTTRDLGVGGDLNIDKKLEMQPLTETQMREFVTAYLSETGEAMLRQLETRLREFGQTPLLLKMLCDLYWRLKDIPHNLGGVFRFFTQIYDRKIKADVLDTADSRRFWGDMLQQLAWRMTQGDKPTEIKVAITKSEAEGIIRQWLQEEGLDNSLATARSYLEDLLKYHLIQFKGMEQIEFRHQLIQEYYAAEKLLQMLPNLKDEEWQWNYLNYLKWTEPVALMLALLEEEDETKGVEVVKLALEVDYQLGARLAGEVNKEWQQKTVGLVKGLDLPQLFKIWLLEKTRSDVAIPELDRVLEDPDFFVRRSAVSALEKIGSEAAVNPLIQALENKEFVKNYNNRYAFSYAIQALETIQDKLKYYYPTPKPMKLNQEVYISYNWQEDSNEIANQLVQAFEARGITITRDKTHTNYKDSIKKFMEQLGQGKCVVAVISDRYLKSENCMFELVEIAENGDFYPRIFPIVLKDARIYKATERLQYIQYWEERIKELETAMKSGGLANLQGITDDLNLYTKIRDRIASLTDTLKDMNTLTPDIHRQSDFEAIIKAVATKLEEDTQKAIAC